MGENLLIICAVFMVLSSSVRTLRIKRDSGLEIDRESQLAKGVIFPVDLEVEIEEEENDEEEEEDIAAKFIEPALPNEDNKGASDVVGGIMPLKNMTNDEDEDPSTFKKKKKKKKRKKKKPVLKQAEKSPIVINSNDFITNGRLVRSSTNIVVEVISSVEKSVLKKFIRIVKPSIIANQKHRRKQLDDYSDNAWNFPESDKKSNRTESVINVNGVNGNKPPVSLDDIQELNDSSKAEKHETVASRSSAELENPKGFENDEEDVEKLVPHSAGSSCDSLINPSRIRGLKKTIERRGKTKLATGYDEESTSTEEYLAVDSKERVLSPSKKESSKGEKISEKKKKKKTCNELRDLPVKSDVLRADNAASELPGLSDPMLSPLGSNPGFKNVPVSAESVPHQESPSVIEQFENADYFPVDYNNDGDDNEDDGTSEENFNHNFNINYLYLTAADLNGLVKLLKELKLESKLQSMNSEYISPDEISFS